MEVIKAQVNPQLLAKAERLFTGTLDGRIIEILQNARRAGATAVQVTNSAGQVTVQDNGRGIADFSALLDLGRSEWNEKWNPRKTRRAWASFAWRPVQSASARATR